MAAIAHILTDPCNAYIFTLIYGQLEEQLSKVADFAL